MLHLEMDYEGSIIDFPVDYERSSIEGLILADEPDCVYWSIDIECGETLIPYSKDERDEFGLEDKGYTEDCHLEISGLGIAVAGWRDLEGKRLEVAYEPEQVHPILPDSPGNFYFAGQHHVPNNNRIVFGKREGRCFGVLWSCVAEGYAGETGTRIAVNTRLLLCRIGVYFHDPAGVSVNRALELVLAVADRHDLEPPDMTRHQWVYWPIRSDVG